MEPTQAVIEAAAKAMYERDRQSWERAQEWEDGADEGRAWWRERAVICLRAALDAMDASGSWGSSDSARPAACEAACAADRSER